MYCAPKVKRNLYVRERHLRATTEVRCPLNGTQATDAATGGVARRRRICRRRLPQCEDFTVPSPDSRVSFKAARHLQVAFSAAAEESQRGVFGRVRVSSPVDVWWRLRAGGAGLGAVAMAGCAIVSMVLSKSNP